MSRQGSDPINLLRVDDLLQVDVSVDSDDLASLQRRNSYDALTQDWSYPIGPSDRQVQVPQVDLGMYSVLVLV